MGKLTVLALRIVLTLVLIGTLYVQVVMMPLLATDLEEFGPDNAGRRAALVAIPVLGIVTVQVTLVCVWRLLTMVRKGTVFSDRAFRYVDIIFGAVTAASLLMFGLAVVLAPGEAVAPGIVLLVCGASLMIAGAALIVLVLRALLAQAVARDAEAHRLRTELDEVI
ncbi:MAG: transporter [Arthrobacter sp.]|nr:transporter [Arthrobacter sp.]